jgi:hypothetical protein
MPALPARHAVFRYYAELNDFLPSARRAHTSQLVLGRAACPEHPTGQFR